MKILNLQKHNLKFIYSHSITVYKFEMLGISLEIITITCGFSQIMPLRLKYNNKLKNDKAIF